MWNITNRLSDLTEYLPENEKLVPIAYLTGAVGSLAYGTYALIDHVRDGRKANSVGNIAKVAAPLVVGSGLVFLGVRGLWMKDGGESSQEQASEPKRGRGRRSNRGGARRARASKPEA
jgi:hypothetical protein